VALIKDGYFQDTYWASNYWQEDYWSEYGTPAPVAPTPPQSVTFGKYPIKRKRKQPQQLFEDREFVNLLITFLETD